MDKNDPCRRIQQGMELEKVLKQARLNEQESAQLQKALESPFADSPKVEAEKIRARKILLCPRPKQNGLG